MMADRIVPFRATSMNSSRRGFSLIEVLVVLSIASILSLLVTVGLQGVLGTVFDGQVSDLASTLSRARAYAMANNTYVFVGIQEVSASSSPNGTQIAGTGRLAVTAVASSDGTRGYQTSIASATPLTSLSVVLPMREYENLHLLAPANPGTALNNLPNAPATSSGQTEVVGSTTGTTSATSLTTFTWPLGASSPQYPTFGTNGTVIQFNPQGEAQIVTAAYTDSRYPWIEIDLAPTHGTAVSSKNLATILIDGASGSMSTYRQ